MRRASLIAFTILVGMSAASCRPFLPELPMPRRAMAKSLSNLQWYVDAYGFASLSTPLFVKPDKTFNFRLENVTPNTFFDAARAEINVRNSGISSSAFGAGANLTGEFDILALRQAQSELANNRSDLATVGEKQVANLPGPGANTPPKNLVPTASGGNASAAVAGGLLSQLGPLQGPSAAGSPAVANEMRSALLMAAGDTATYAILSLLGEPEKNASFTGQSVLFGVSTVAVDPGWLTQKGFAADVSTKVSINWVPARAEVERLYIQHLEQVAKTSPDKDKPAQPVSDGQSKPNGITALIECIKNSKALSPEAIEDWCESPAVPPNYDQSRYRPYLLRSCKDSEVLVSAVSPMADAQLLDAQSTTKRQTELALSIKLALSYAGAKAAADTFANWAKQQQEDIESRSANVVVNSYSMSGGVFGFQVGPRLLADPKQRGGQASMEKLVRQSFPTLLIMSYDEQTLGIKVLVRSEKDKDSGKETPFCNVVEPELVMKTATRWQPLNKKADILQEDEFFAVRLQAAAAWDALNRADENEPTDKEVRQKQELDKKIRQMQHKDEKVQSKPYRGNYIADSLSQDRWEDRQMYRQHMEALQSRLEGVGYRTTLPVQVLTDKLSKQPNSGPTCKGPSVVEILAPSSVVLSVDSAGNVIPRTVELALVGRELNNLKLDSVAIAMGKASWVDAAGKVQPTPVVKKEGDSLLRVWVRVDSAASPLVFSLTTADSSTVITTPPLIVTSEPSKSIQIEHKKLAGAETYSFPRGTTDDVIKAVVQKDRIATEKPVKSPPEKSSDKPGTRTP